MSAHRIAADRVPWHRSLFVRIFAAGALVAVAAVAAATWATVRSTSVAVQDQQRRSLHAEATTYDALVGYAATHASWDGAQGLVDRLATEVGEQVAVVDTTGGVLVGSRGVPARVDPVRVRATLDPFAVDPALMADARSEGTRSRTTDQPAPAPAAAAAERCTGTDCGRRAVPLTERIDSRARGPFADPDDPAWRQLQDRVNRCLQRRDVPPVLGIDVNFQPIVNQQGHDPVVVSCLQRHRRALLQDSVAPAAQLVVGAEQRPAEVLWDLTGRARLRVLGVAAVVLVATVVLSGLLAAQVTRPMRRLAGAAQRLGAGESGVRVPEGRADEVGAVARAFNQMSERREELEQQRRRTASDVSHELRTPIANVRGWIEAAQDGLVALEPPLLASLHEDTVHLQQLVEDLHQLQIGESGGLRLEVQRIDLADWVDRVVLGFAPTADRAQVTVSAAVRAGTVTVDPARMRQVLANLLANAIRHTPPGGRVQVQAQTDAHRFELVVQDTGEGIPAADVPWVFDRFHRVDASRSRLTGGTGLGLAVVRQVVEAHGGSVSLTSTLDVGTRVEITIPQE